MFLLTLRAIVFAQECGPSCLVCSGSTDGSLLGPNSFLATVISIPGGEEENGVVKLRHGIFPRFDAGVGYTVKSEKYVWNTRFQAFTGGEKIPGIIHGEKYSFENITGASLRS